MINKMLKHNLDFNRNLNFNNFINRSIIILLLCSILLTSCLPALPFILGCVKYELTRKQNLNINLELVNPFIQSLSADTSNRLVLRIKVLDKSGKPVPYAKVDLFVEGILDQKDITYMDNVENNISNNNTKNTFGRFSKESIRVDKNGQSLVEYIPPAKIPNINDKNIIFVALKIKSI